MQSRKHFRFVLKNIPGSISSIDFSLLEMFLLGPCHEIVKITELDYSAFT